MQIELNGRKVFFATGGRDFDAGQPVILFVHGAAFDHTVWKLQTRYFAWHGYSVMALDLPGHGRSEAPALHTIGEMADWLAQLLATLAVKQAWLVGHSMGSLACLEAAGRYPDRVARLSLLGCCFPMPVGDALLQPAKANQHLALDRLTAWGYGPQTQRGGHKMPGLWMMGGGLRLVEQAAEDVLYTDLAACNDYDNGLVAAKAVTCPTQFIIGARDMMTRAKAAKAFAQAFDKPRIDILAGAGHSMMDEKPDATLDALRSFADERN